MKQRDKLQGKDGFEKYYHELYGERWESLKASLLSESVYVKLDFSGSQPYFLDPAITRDFPPGAAHKSKTLPALRTGRHKAAHTLAGSRK